jgi:hypothetical protein
VVKNQAFTKQDRAVFPNLHCFVGTTGLRKNNVAELAFGFGLDLADPIE